MNAAGFSPFRLFRPPFYATCVVAIMVAFIASYMAPDGMRRIKQWDAEITTLDVLTNILQPGRFAQLDQNLTIRIRERQPGGVLAGIFVDDRRDPKERVTIIADHGTILRNEAVRIWCSRTETSSVSKPASATRRWWRSAVTRSTCRSSPIMVATSRWESENATSGNCCRRRRMIPFTSSCPASSGPNS